MDLLRLSILLNLSIGGFKNLNPRPPDIKRMTTRQTDKREHLHISIADKFASPGVHFRIK